MPRALVAGDGTINRTDDFIPVALDRFWVQVTATATLVPVPAGTKYILFSFPDGNYGVKYGTDNSIVAALPSSSGTTTSIDEYNPAQRVTRDITYLSIVSATAHAGLITFYS